MALREESCPLAADRNICNFLWYGGLAGEGLRSDGVDDLPSSKSECSILSIARRLSDRGFRVPALSLAALLSDLTEGAAFALPRP